MMSIFRMASQFKKLPSQKVPKQGSNTFTLIEPKVKLFELVV